MTQPTRAEAEELERRFHERYGAPPALVDVELLRSVIDDPAPGCEPVGEGQGRP